jgi:small subunit ribosomal protein S14
MKKLIAKDLTTRKTVVQFEKKKIILNSIFKNINLVNFVRWKASMLLVSLPKKSNKTRISNRCILTGRKKKIHKKYKFSRIVFFNLANAGLISGLKKATW